MILSANSKQFTLRDDGQIYYQPDSTNPLPGEPLARVSKGDSLLQPVVALLDGCDTGAEDRAAVTEFVGTWLKAHIYTVLEPLFALVVDETLAEPVKEIALKLFAGVGIVPRGEIEESIGKLDPEMRKALRDKKVRLGPLLVFIPDLNKPAAVRLRALLWSLFHDAPIPAPVPRDGAMSVVVDPASANGDFYRAIGYPMYGPRAVRIDMLDRVINAVYDGSKDGKFQAQHSMAEWMGCPIADLYAVLEAMGHKRIEGSAPVPENAPVAAETAAEAVADVAAVTAPAPVEPVEGEAVAAPETAVVVLEPVKKQEQKKPELDFFFLRRGKAHNDRGERRPRADKPAFPKERVYSKYPAKKPAANEGEAAEGGQDFKKKREDDRRNRKFGEGDEGEGRRKDRKGGKGGRQDRESRFEPRTYTAEASQHDNPFAVLQNLKLK